MKKILFIISLSLLPEMAFSSASSFEDEKIDRLSVTNAFATEESIQDWALSPSKVKGIQKKIISERAEKMTFNEAIFGYSFPGVSFFRQMVLLTVKDKFDADRKRPPVANLASGNGSLDWKVMSAGGNLHAVEISRELAQKANKNIWGAKDLWKVNDREEAKACYKVFPGDALSPKVKWDQRKHDIIISENLIHFLTPDNVDLLMQRIVSNLNPKGHVLLACNAPFFDPEVNDFYESQAQSNPRFPGYMIRQKGFTQVTYTNSSTGKILEEAGGIEFLSGYPKALSLTDESLEPGHVYSGVFKNGNLSHITDRVKTRNTRVKYKDAVVNVHVETRTHYDHTMMNFFKTKELVNLCKKLGLEVAMAFYINHLGYKTDNVTPGNTYNACVIAYLP